MDYLIKNFTDPIEIDLNFLGGKGQSLANLFQNKFPVPNGFIITTKAFDYFLDKQQLTYDKHIIPQYEKILSVEIPYDLSESILKYFDNLDTKLVAVRSSATVEDSETSSFAGQFESFLRVDRDDLLPKIKSCWASLFNKRAEAYGREIEGISKMAVIIQKMIEPDVAGVCFSANPVSGNKDEIVIEAVCGSGEPLVQGIVSPSHYVIDKNNLEIRNKTLNGLEELTIEHIKEIVNLVLNVERFYNKLIDIEWAIKENIIYLLQARKITNLQ